MRGERLGRLGGLSGERQRLRGVDVRQPGRDRTSELGEKRVRLAGPAKGTLHAALFEVRKADHPVT